MRAVRVVPPTGSSPDELAERKGGLRVSVCLPARNEIATVGLICRQIVAGLVERVPLVDELIVLDDGSTDNTAMSAREAGAAVVRVSDLLADQPAGRGKGNVLWRSLAAATGDIVVWCDSDLTSFSPSYITRMLAPLLTDPEVDFVKAFYERLTTEAGSGGGRVTELVARPLLSRFFPELASVIQPLGGEYAGRRSVLEQVPFVEGYGVETGLLIDLARSIGTDRMVQVDLGYRTHRHRPLLQLTEQAAEIIAVVLHRAGLAADSAELPLIKSDGSETVVALRQRPPFRDIVRLGDHT